MADIKLANKILEEELSKIKSMMVDLNSQVK